mmetsp:Transcript_59339/g.97723  ORF Transcript_59339/g.97723 Transcript_59339/m.97723 type:complete len:91 (-) Transcript_59339:75-347(-)
MARPLSQRLASHWPVTNATSPIPDHKQRSADGGWWQSVLNAQKPGHYLRAGSSRRQWDSIALCLQHTKKIGMWATRSLACSAVCEGTPCP